MPKQRYLCIQRSQSGKSEKPSPAQMEEMYAKFHAWKEKFQKNIVDMGGKLGSGKVVTSEGATDGPFVEAKEVVGGFMIVSAESLEEAMEVARESPGVVMPGSRVRNGAPRAIRNARRLLPWDQPRSSATGDFPGSTLLRRFS